MKKLRKYVMRFILVVFLLTVIMNIYVIYKGNTKIVDNQTAQEFKADAIVVLGAGLQDGEPGSILQDRLNTAIELYKKGKTKKIIMSGDHSSDFYNEVSAMKLYAMQKGVPSQDIYLDHYGLNTYDSMYRAKYIFGVKSLIVVTQKYHLYRALHIAENLNLDVKGVASSLEWFNSKLEQEVREYFARVKSMYSLMMQEKSEFITPVVDLNGSGDDTNEQINNFK
ncbi:YdcF family protein [Carnobacteriaceae bacterium zg-ZUI78]|uniref:SanA/YdcF family protein n=1 Tax=Granulicatella sp. zg-84 TaxID=2678503 RepID=UPI0013C03F3A|nr:YdcF family protein [Granulicatella sp. zg-84]MBS4750788.1 YdcF family protein [Carnobacteriaceae bacterium zg-ZUI78]NEW66506.1 hypothetical protein [Granulicatella sp. zg-84]QMI85506.1 YdcF family protein [Carnobacteriaceae bacterium zg-84]